MAPFLYVAAGGREGSECTESWGTTDASLRLYPVAGECEEKKEGHGLGGERGEGARRRKRTGRRVGGG